MQIPAAPSSSKLLCACKHTDELSTDSAPSSKKPLNWISINNTISRKEKRLSSVPAHTVLDLDCVPVSVFILPLFVAPVMAA